MIATLNRGVGAGIALAMRPWAGASPWLGLAAVSLVLALLALLAFKFCSNQRALRRARNRMLAHVLELHLFRDDLAGIFGAFARVLLGALGYIKETLKPLLVLAPPLLLLLVHLSGWFEWRPLRRAEPALLTARADAPLTAVAAPGLRLESAPFVSPLRRETIWRFWVEDERAPLWIEVRSGAAAERKSVNAGRALVAVSPARVRDGAWARLLHPAEPPLPAGGPLRELAVDYPRREITLGGRRVNWLLAVFVLSLGFGLVLKYPLRVEW